MTAIFFSLPLIFSFKLVFFSNILVDIFLVLYFVSTMVNLGYDCMQLCCYFFNMVLIHCILII